MRDAIIGLLDKLDVAIAESASVLGDDGLEPVARVARDARARLSYPESMVVAALAGGTGSGKSSLMNAILGSDLAITGGLRPVTSRPLAAVPASSGGTMDGLLDLLEIEDRETHDGPGWLCLIDLPDNDSLEMDHRHRVEALLPRVDAVVWVTDVEKYRDASLHHDFLRQLAAHGDRFVFALNQVDRLDPEDVGALSEDLVTALSEDGMNQASVVLTSADPGSGPSQGIQELVVALEDLGHRREVVYRRLVTDLTEAASMLDAGLPGHVGDFEEQWRGGCDQAALMVEEGELAAAAGMLSDLIEKLAVGLGGDTADELRGLGADLPRELISAVQADGPAQSPRRRFRRPVPVTPVDAAGDARRSREWLAATLTPKVREVLGRPALARARVAEVALAAADLERAMRKLASRPDGI